MKVKTKKLMTFGPLFLALLSVLSVGCSHISQERSPSSLEPSFANCEMVSVDKNKYQIHVDGEAYPDASTYRADEAERLLTRFGQTQTCHQ